VTCANAPMLSVIAPPQKPLKGETTTLLLVLYGSVGGASGACVWVKPTIAIIATGGTYSLSSLPPAPTAFMYMPILAAWARALSAIAGNGVVRSRPPPTVQLEPTAERRQVGEIGVTRAAGLPGLAGKTGQSFRWRREADRQETRCDNERPDSGDDPERPGCVSEATPTISHRTVSMDSVPTHEIVTGQNS
jgi:hypothetical protein